MVRTRPHSGGSLGTLYIVWRHLTSHPDRTQHYHIPTSHSLGLKESFLYSILREVLRSLQHPAKVCSNLTSLMRPQMATHSSVLARRIPRMGELGGLPSMGSHRIGHNWSDLAAAADLSDKFHVWKYKWNFKSERSEFECWMLLLTFFHPPSLFYKVTSLEITLNDCFKN